MKAVSDDNDLMIINKSGITIRMPAEEIRVAGRATQGVKLISIREGDSIAAVCVVSKNEEADPVAGQPAPEQDQETTETTETNNENNQ